MAKNSSPSGDSPRKKRKLPTGINLTPKGEYRARIYFQGRQQSIGTFSTITDAKAALSIARADIQRGVFVPLKDRREQEKAAREETERETTTVDDVAEKFWKFLEASGKARGTIYTYKSRYRAHMAPTFGDKPVTAITVSDIEDWHAGLVAAKGHGVARNVYLTASSLFGYAAGEDHGLSSTFKPYIETSPVGVAGATKHRPKQRTREPVATSGQLKFLAANSGRYRLAVFLAGWSALRLGELLALTRADLSKSGGQYWVRVDKQIQARGSGLYESPPKSEAGVRNVPVPPALNSEVEDHLESIPAKRSSLLFPRQDGSWTHPNTLRNTFNRAREKWDREHPSDTLDGFTFHGLRHTALTRVGQAGATLEELKRYAGHSSAEVVSKYQHATKDRLAMLAQTLSDQM